MSSWLKRTRRRAKQKILEATGASDGVESDPEWETLWATFSEDCKAIKKVQKRLNNMPPVFSRWSSDLNGEVEEISKYFAANDAPEDLRSATSSLAAGFDKVARGLWPNIEEKFESQVQAPFKQILEVTVPEIKEKAELRTGIRTDVGSYRRKVQKINDSDKADPERKKIVRQKLNDACQQYEALDAELKTTLRKFHKDRFLMVRPMVQNALFYQLDVLSRSTKFISEAVGALPASARERVISELAEAHESNGLRPPTEKGWGVAVGKLFGRKSGSTVGEEDTRKGRHQSTGRHQSMSSEPVRQSSSPHANSTFSGSMTPPEPPMNQQQEEEVPTEQPAFNDEVPLQGQSTFDAEPAENPFAAGQQDRASDPFTADEEPAQPVDAFLDEIESTPAANDDDGAEWVIADFDFASSDSGDLPFSKGDRIKVLGKEGGWWKGEFNGAVGMFPANYSHPE